MSSVIPHLACVFLLALCCSSMAFPFNISMEGSGNEPELIFPTSRSTQGPPPSLVSPSPSPPPSITTTFIRIKDFLFNRVVDFLRDNLLLITVVMSLLVVFIFIVCCASAMSHKRKLEAYYPPKKHVPRTYMTGQGAGRPQQQQQQAQPDHKPQATTSYLRTPSKALVGEKEGKDPRPKPQEAPKQVEEVEEVEVPKEEEKKKKVEEPKPSTSGAGNGQVMVCTCHLKKAH